MEVFLYNSTVCRLCGEENDSGTLLYSCEENNQNLSEIINTYLPIKVSDDGQLPRTICPGCTIQLEAAVEFLNLIINGQKVIRELHQREKEYKKTVLNGIAGEHDVVTDNIVYEISTTDGVYQVEHPVALQVAGLERPKRKRGRPPKKPKSPEELAQEAAARDREIAEKREGKQEDVSGKRLRKTPTRFREAVQGKELDRIFKEEGVTDGEESEPEVKPNVGAEAKPVVPREPEVIGHMETSGELVVVIKGKGRGRPKGRMRQTREECAICGMEFSCVGRYMSHIAQHGPVLYQCGQCTETFTTRLTFREHQQVTGHAGQNVIPCGKDMEQIVTDSEFKPEALTLEPEGSPLAPGVESRSLPRLLPDPDRPEDLDTEFLKSLVNGKEELEISSSPATDKSDKENTQPVDDGGQGAELTAAGPKGKVKLKCPHCEKLFSSKQSKSMHIKAVHNGERPYTCTECGCVFAYPRSLALHVISHRRRRARTYACDLCGKVLNHPSSVVYHKEAEHAGQRYVCSKCGKCFKHKQLLQRHQLVHSQLRPYSCKTCNASFKTKANLLNHQLLHSGVKKFTCEICKHKFAHKTSLTLHMRWHTGSKPFVCQTCGKSFSQKGNLSEHERIHTGERPYACTLCPRAFTTSSQYRLHARRHQPDKPYACAHCPKRFSTRGSWSAHQRREAGVRAHQCGECARAFTERWALLKHMRRHTGERPFRCAHCPRTFADCSNLNKHKKQVHKQISLLVTPDGALPAAPEPQPADAVAGAEAQDTEDESVIYVTYDVDEAEPEFHILDPEQAASYHDSKVLTTCELYPGPSLLVSPEMEEMELEHEQLDNEQLEQLELTEPLVLDDDERIAVTDEQGNPLHFTMQDGTRLAITSADGRSLQVVTQDGQTIPVEINGYAEEDEADESANTVLLDMHKDVDSDVSSPVTHYFTIV